MASSNAQVSLYSVLFPNWKRAPAAAFLIAELDDTTCPASSITGLTIVNYGTATGGAGGDITDIYWNIVCGAKGDTGIITMSYAGLWVLGGPARPTWTWSGPPVGMPADPCTDCWCYPGLNVYTDIGPCPTDGATIELGPGYNIATFDGGMTDDCGYFGPTMTVIAQSKTIVYALKRPSDNLAAPGDTVTYTVYYSRPGPVNLSSITITDTLPGYTHYLAGSGNPAPDIGWDPEPGPPPRLRWTLNGPFVPGAGPTSEVTFQLTVDWGNGEGFEPGSGDTAAPEGYTILNRAHMSWDPINCAPGRISNVGATVVRRYLFYMVGDNDVLFASRFGSPDDEMVYSYFIKNVSSTKTWWNVTLWDTVPVELDVWGPGLGFEDRCVGWTMTPSGCAVAGPGSLETVPGTTLLTWRLDMSPEMTLSVRWKARVKTSAQPDDIAMNLSSLMALGRPGVVGGTGHQRVPKNFVHLAKIMLRTTYLSYVGIGGDGLGKRGVFITFYPLNKATNFELRGLEYGPADAWTQAGGLSASIGNFIGSCIGGFSCAIGSPGGTAGCKTERIPADYSCYSGGTPADKPYGTVPPCGGSIGPGSACSNDPQDPYHFIYKVVSNSPILWQIFTCDGNNAHTFAPSTSMSFSGFMHYAFSRTYAPDQFNVMNTSIGPSGTLDPSLPTTMHMFWWDFTTLSWVYDTSYEVDAESHVMYCPLPMCNAHYRFISSQTQVVIREGEGTFFSGQSNFESFSPSRSTGVLTMSKAGDAMYIFANMKDGYRDVQAVVANMGAVDATYKIEMYIPRNTYDVPGCKPPWMNDTSGKWYLRKTGSVPAGFANPANPHVYGTMYDSTYIFSDPPSGTGGLWRLTLLEDGGPIEINAGADVYSVYGGGSLMHPRSGEQVGANFWIGYPHSWCFGGCPCDAPFTNLFTIDVFCPKTGMSVRCEDEKGYDATYTTTGPDQCVAFLRITRLPTADKSNIRITVTGGNAIAMYNECQPSHKFFTAPFVQTGVHYDIITPPVVYLGQSFWLTIVVVDSDGSTKTNYDGTSSFTSTDPGAEVELTPMDNYDYNWSGGEGGVKIFVKVTMTELGLQTIIASDTQDGSITGLTTLMVVGVDVKLTKRPRLQVAASGDAVQFRICFSNYSSASATNFIITDKIPDGVTYVQDTAANHLCGSTKGFSGVTVAYSTTGNDPNDYQTMPGGGVANATWLRWTIPQIGVSTTGCVCFKVAVD